jgi:hypothetical protein
MAPPVIRWLLALAILGSAIVVVRSISTAPETYPIADTATTSLYALRAARGELQVGSYSRFGWNHPGPLLYQILAGPYAIAGRREIAIKWTALAMNLAWLGATLLVAGRRSPPLATCLTVALVPLLWREQRLLFLAWNPLVPVLALPLAVVLAADLHRERPWTAAGLAATLSFCVQAHAGLALVSAVIGIGAVLHWLRFRESAGRPWWTSPVVRAGAATLAVLWARPAWHEVRHDPGNLASMVRFLFDRAHVHPSWTVAIEASGYMLTGPVLPGWEAIAGGLPGMVTATHGVLYAGHLLGTLGVAVWSWRRSARHEAACAALCALATLSVPVAAHGIVGPMDDYLLLWATGVGATNIAVVLSAVAPRVDVTPRFVRPLAVAAVIGWAIVGGIRLMEKHAEQARDTTMRALAGDLGRYCDARGIARPLVDFDPDAWQELAGVVLQFAKADRPIAVSAAAVHMFGAPSAPNGREDASFYLMSTAAALPAALEGRTEWVSTRGLMRLVRVAR